MTPLTIKDVTNLESLSDKWKSFGMKVHEVNGHDVTELKKTFKKLNCNKGYVNVVICHTVMSKGIKMFEGDPYYHWKGGIDNELHNKMIESIEEYKWEMHVWIH